MTLPDGIPGLRNHPPLPLSDLSGVAGPTVKTLPTVAEQKARAAYLATLSCPRCGAAGRLYEAQPEYTVSEGPDRSAALRVRPAILGCSAPGCTWTGSEQPAPAAETEGPEVLSFSTLERMMDREITPGSGGGGGNGKTRKKPAKRGPRNLEPGPPPGGPDRTTRTTVVETKSESYLLKLTKGDKALSQRLAAEHGLSLAELLLKGLRLTDVLTPRQWKAWRREAEARGVTPEALLTLAVQAWWDKHVPELPLLA